MSTYSLDSLDWHDLPVSSLELNERGFSLVVTPYNEVKGNYDSRTLHITGPDSFQFKFAGVLSAKDLGSIEVSTFQYAARSSGSIDGTIGFLPGQAGYWEVSFTNAAWSLDDA